MTDTYQNYVIKLCYKAVLFYPLGKLNQQTPVYSAHVCIFVGPRWLCKVVLYSEQNMSQNFRCVENMWLQFPKAGDKFCSGFTCSSSVQ